MTEKETVKILFPNDEKHKSRTGRKSAICKIRDHCSSESHKHDQVDLSHGESVGFICFLYIYMFMFAVTILYCMILYIVCRFA